MKPWQKAAIALALVVVLTVGGTAAWQYFKWDDVDPTGIGRLDPTARANLEKVGAKADRLRAMVGLPITVSPHGGYMPTPAPPGWPSREPTSQHRKGKALDLLTPQGMTTAEFHAIAKVQHKAEGGGLGLYYWGVHVDIGPTRGPWPSDKPKEKA